MWHGWLWVKNEWTQVVTHQDIDDAHGMLLREAKRRRLEKAPRELTQGAMPPEPSRASVIASVRGSLKHLGGPGSEVFLRDRHEDSKKECE